MKEVIVKIRHSNRTTAVSIPKEIAAAAGFDEGVFAGVKLNVDGTLTIRRVHVRTGNERVI